LQPVAVDDQTANDFFAKTGIQVISCCDLKETRLADITPPAPPPAYPIGPVIGGTIGAILGVLLVATLVYQLCGKKKKPKATYPA